MTLRLRASISLSIFKPQSRDTSDMALDFNDYKCEICGAPCTQVAFATFLCNNPECEKAARENRGGPGGHMKAKAQGRPITPEDICRPCDRE